MVTASQPTSTTTPARRIHSSRTIGLAVTASVGAGMAVTLKRSTPRKHAYRLWRQRNSQVLALRNLQVAHEIDGEIGKNSHARRRLRLELRAAEGPKKVERGDPGVHPVRCCCIDIAHPNLFRSQADTHATAANEPPCIRAVEFDRTEAQLVLARHLRV